MDLYELYNLRSELQKQLKEIDDQISTETSRIRKTVKHSTDGFTHIFEFGDRVVKAKKGSRGRYKIWEGKRVIEAESLFHNIASIRLDLAMGRM